MRRQVRQLIAAAGALAALGGVAAAEGAPARVEKDAYVVELVAGPEVRPGAPGQVEVKMSARGGFHLNADYPSSFKVIPASDAVTYPRPKVDRASGLSYERCASSEESCAARAQVPFVIAKPGTHSVGGLFAFSVCDKEQCLIEKVPLAVTVTAR